MLVSFTENYCNRQPYTFHFSLPWYSIFGCFFFHFCRWSIAHPISQICFAITMTIMVIFITMHPFSPRGRSCQLPLLSFIPLVWLLSYHPFMSAPNIILYSSGMIAIISSVHVISHYYPLFLWYDCYHIISSCLLPILYFIPLVWLLSYHPILASLRQCIQLVVHTQWLCMSLQHHYVTLHLHLNQHFFHYFIRITPTIFLSLIH